MQSKPTSVSLFSGGGGLDIGAHLAGFDNRLCLEFEPTFAQTLEGNRFLSHATFSEFDEWFESVARKMGRASKELISLTRKRLEPAVGVPNAVSNSAVIAADIADVPTEQILAEANLEVGEIDLLFGGPPCQSFSKSGKKGSLTDLRGQLFLQFARVIREAKPRFFLFENVRGILASRAEIVTVRCKIHGSQMAMFEEVAKNAEFFTCRFCGSKCELLERKNNPRGAIDIILDEFNSLDYTCELLPLDASSFGVPQSRQRVFIIGSRDHEALTAPIPSHSLAKTNNGEQLSIMDSLLPPPPSVWDTLFHERNPYHPWPLDPNVAKLWVKNIVRPHDEPVTWDLRRISPTIGAHQSAKLAIAHNGVPEEQLWRQQWHTKGRRQKDRPPVAVDHTYLSDEDLLALQSFPRSWYLAGTRMERAFQIGNAVPPLLAKGVLDPVRRAFG